jgi:N6-adenosine-specific RNA methylase IME4
MPYIRDIDIFVIDPPWPKKKGGLRKVAPNQDRNMDYSTMPVQDIFHLLDTRIFVRAKQVHTVFLWGVDQFLHKGEEEMINRGYRMHARLVWDKCNGVAPGFSVRYSHEYLTWFYKPTFQPVSTESRGKLCTVFREPGREHSRKPDCVYKAIQYWYPYTTKMDVFSREKRDGWKQFGDQIDHFSKQ